MYSCKNLFRQYLIFLSLSFYFSNCLLTFLIIFIGLFLEIKPIYVFLNGCNRYHIKYMFVGDMMKNEVECIIRRLRPALQMRLRFIAHINIDEIHTS